MHGEYKAPAGKLVVVDAEVAGGRLRRVEVSGDFFLEPPEALGQITAALEGAPADLAEDAIAARIEARLEDGAALIGFDALAVARAVRRALA